MFCTVAVVIKNVHFNTLILILHTSNLAKQLDYSDFKSISESSHQISFQRAGI